MGNVYTRLRSEKLSLDECKDPNDAGINMPLGKAARVARDAHGVSLMSSLFLRISCLQG